LTGLNTKRDSGISGNGAIGITSDVSERKVKEKKAKKKARVVRFNLNIKSKRLIPKKHLQKKEGGKKEEFPSHNRSVYVEHRHLTGRAIVKAVTRGLVNYRKDLVPLAIKKVSKLQKFKNINKWKNRSEAKKQK